MKNRLMSFILISAIAPLFVGTARAADAAADAGAKIYAAKCSSCHAKDGKGNPSMAKVFKLEPEAMSLVSDAAQKNTDADLIKATTDGKNKMPAYKGKLSDDDIKAVVAYVRTLAPAKAK